MNIYEINYLCIVGILLAGCTTIVRESFVDTGGEITFFSDYTRSVELVKAQKSDGNQEGVAKLNPKPKFDFDLMSHSNWGLRVGEECASVWYETANNLPSNKGSIEMVIKPYDWEPMDNLMHIFLQTVTFGKSPWGKLMIYKYRKSGIAVYLEYDKDGNKIFINKKISEWKKDTWHHLMVTYDLSKEVTLYVDGIRAGSADISADFKWPENFSIGPATKGYGYKGGKTTISSVTVYDAVLSDAAVAGLANDKIPELDIKVDDVDKITGDRIIGKASPWFKAGKPRIGMKALADNTVLQPWLPVKYKNKTISVWNRDYSLNNTGIIDQVVSNHSDILASPIEIEIAAQNFKGNLKFSKPKILKYKKGVVQLERKVKNIPDSNIRIRYTFEYDGLVWCELIIPPEELAKIEQLRLSLPYKNETAKFIHYVGAPVEYVSQNLPCNSYSRALPDREGILFESGLRTTVWIGDNDKGLLWFMESDQYWHPKDRDNVIQAVRDKSNNVKLIIDMIAEKVPKSPVSDAAIKFGLMATPVKPLMEGWRGWTFTAQYDAFKGKKRGNKLIYWPSEWRFIPLDPEPHRALNVEYEREKIKNDRKQGRSIMPYWSRLHYVVKDENKINPDAEKVKEEWMAVPNAPGGGTFQCYRAAATSGWSDYLVWCFEEWPKVMGHTDGIYLDETQPIPNSNARSGGGYVDYTGKRRPTYDFFGSRNMVKRMAYNCWKRTNERPTAVAHCSTTYTMQSLSMFEIMLIGEQYYSGYFKNNPELLPPDNDRLYYYSYALPMDRLRAECYWKQWGEVMLWLPCLKNQKDIMGNPVPTRDMLSRVMQADMIIWPLWCDFEEVCKTWQFREEFKIADPEVVFVPYWENKIITCGTKDVVIGYYKKGGQYLVLVSNLNRKPEKVEISFGQIPVSTVKNAETKQDIEVENGTIKLDMRRNDYTALRINY